MATRTSGRIVLPNHPAELLKLAQQIYDKHVADGTASPLHAQQDFKWDIEGPKIAPCNTSHLEAEKAVKLLSQFCKGRTQQAARLKLHSACAGCGYEPLCSKWSGANTPIIWTFKEDVNG